MTALSVVPHGLVADTVRNLITETANNAVSLAPRKRPRGRPRKPPQLDRRCTDSFDTVALAIVAVARQKVLWSAAKELVRVWADRGKSLSPGSRRVLGFLVNKLNRNAGYDWHGVEAIATERCVSVPTVNRAFR
jgi:hypothetical protein